MMLICSMSTCMFTVLVGFPGEEHADNGNYHSDYRSHNSDDNLQIRTETSAAFIGRRGRRACRIGWRRCQAGCRLDTGCVTR